MKQTTPSRMANPRLDFHFSHMLPLDLMGTSAFLDDPNINMGRLSLRGYGEVRPEDTTDSVEGRAKNRRVEIRINQSDQESGSPVEGEQSIETLDLGFSINADEEATP